jgi:ParB-like chromosome segregation protein Spo0J
MSGVAKSPELPPNLFVEPPPIERENKVAAAGPINSVDRRGQTSSLAGFAMTKKHEFHDLANIFPILADGEAKALAHDISEHGLREPITLLEGKILDGRNRYIACRDAGVEPRFTSYRGDNPAAYVVSLNLKRRHLDESQRAMVAKKLATLEHGQRQTGKFAGVTTQAEAASMLNVSERLVRTAGAVIDKAVPEIVTAVEKGDVSVSAAAQFAKQPKEEQAKQIAESVKPADAVEAFRDSRQISAEAVGDDGPRVVHPSDSKAVTHLSGVVKRFADFCRTSPATSVAADILPGEFAEVRVGIADIRQWLGQFVTALGRVEPIDIAAKAAEGPRDPDIVPPAKYEPVAAASDLWRDLDIPTFLDRRGKAPADASKPSMEVPAL